MIQAAPLCYCQYPVIKKINNDTVVIMTLKQGEEINTLYRSYNDRIILLKDSLTIKNLNNDSLSKALHKKSDSIFYWRGKYEASRELYRAPKSRDYEKEQAFDTLQKILLMGIIVLQFSQLN